MYRIVTENIVQENTVKNITIADVAEALGYERATKAIQDHVDTDDKDEIPIQDSIGRMQKTPVINESGLYALIFGSKLESAKRFKHWVTSEVLPAIRRHSLYAVDDMLNNPDALIEALQAYKAERMQRLALEAVLVWLLPRCV